MKLLGKPVAEKLKNQTQQYIYDHNLHGYYIVNFCLNKNDDSARYVQMKSKYASDINLNMIGIYDYNNLEGLLVQIDMYNMDAKCLGILFQMPLPDELKLYRGQIIDKINNNKDIDGLKYPKSNLLPATPRAVVNILDYYDIYINSNKKFLVIGQSDIVGKPLADYLEKMGAVVYRADIYTDLEDLVERCQIADVVISATGDLGFLDRRYIYSDREQILIDVGFGVLDGGIIGDINWKDINLQNKIYTPVPGGVGPVTVASLFDNIRYVN